MSDGIEGASLDTGELKAAIDAHSILAITDARGRITHANDKFCEISKFTREELLGQDHRIINSGYHPPSFFRELWTTIASGRVWRGEIRNRAKDGSYYWVDTTIYPSMDSTGKPRQYLAIRTDVTHRKQDQTRLADLATSLAEKNRELETILYVASHDLRSPLVNIQGFSQELSRTCRELNAWVSSEPGEMLPAARLREVLNEDVKEALDYILSGVKRIDAVLAGLLRLSRLGRAALRIERVDMGELVAGLLKVMEFQLKEAGARVRVEELPTCVGDATQIHQVFTNLVDNALKYRDRSRPCRVRICGERKGEEVWYSVEDNGIGIAAEHHQRIFEIFHRLDPGMTEGEGLGLTLVQRILERQGGRIWVQSECGKGSIFWVSLPAEKGSARERGGAT